MTSDAVIEIDDLSAVAVEMHATRRILVLIVDQPGCEFCAYLYENEIIPLIRSKTVQTLALFGRLDMTSDRLITDFSARKLAAEGLARHYQANITPTVLFLDHNGEQLDDALIGISSRDFYGYYLETSIARAHRKLLKQLD